MTFHLIEILDRDITKDNQYLNTVLEAVLTLITIKQPRREEILWQEMQHWATRTTSVITFRMINKKQIDAEP